jgi:TPR repeat protein
MADLAHDPSGPASSEATGITQQVKQPASSERGKLRVFISYSREDLKFADQLDAALSACGFECLIDRHGISGGEDWKRRLGNLISEADTVVFVLSPISARSEICDWEVEEAARLNKRILPVNCRPLDGVSPSPRLRELNYIFFYEEPRLSGSGFGSGLANLVTALNADFDWLREHTRYLQHAIEWDSGGRPANRLLSGDDIGAAKAWLARRPRSAPEPTALHLDFIRASEEEAEARLSEQRKQLAAMTAALGSATTIIARLWDRMDSATLKEAFTLFQTGADYGDRSSMHNLAMSYLNGRGVAQDYGKAHEWYEKAANNGVSNAMTALGELYANGRGVEQDHVKAREWYEKAADKGEARAMVLLGALYAEGQGVKQDYAKAREWFEKAAAKDISVAMYSLGLFYAYGRGVAQDYVKAREWWEKAAAKDNSDAMYDLGLLYENGSGVAQDYVKAREWYEKAAAKDNSVAMYSLGLFYANGRGVAQDYVKAREWYEKAADKGDTSAMYGLGLLYANGDEGVAQDYAKAREWYKKAADKGNASAMSGLGYLYENGLGVMQDHGKARELYEAAAAKGNDVPAR